MADMPMQFEDESEQSDAAEGLRQAVESQINESSRFLDSELSQFREKANDLYYGRPYGDEVEGFSAVVSRDVMETVEWILAQLLRIFTGDKFCEFEPRDPEDVPAAEQQTDYVNHVIMQDCSGTILLYDWFKDALMHRLGVVHWGYQELVEPQFESYTGLAPDQFEALFQGQDVELVERTNRVEGEPAVPVIDCRIKWLKRSRDLKVECIPGEEFSIETGARSIEDANFVGHKMRRTKSYFRSTGVPESVIERLVGGEADINDTEAQSRNVDQSTIDGTSDSLGDGGTDQERFWEHICYIRYDLDGDGFAELLRVRYVGGEIVETDHASEIPYATLCPVRTPHRLIGLSYTDVVEDIQRIKTVLWRQSLDNLYLSNKPMREVVEGRVNLKDMAEATVGGSVRVKEPNMIRDLTVPSMIDGSLSMIGYIDSVREERTGTSAASQGRDADQIHDTAKGMAQMVSQAQLRVELVARLFAEGGVKRLFVGLYNAIVRNQDGPRMVRLRGKFVKVDPREWRERNNAVVTVGLGVGTREAQLGSLQTIATVQQNLLEKGVPLVTVEKLKYTLTKFIEAAGYKNAGSFLAEPDEIPPPAPPPKSDALQIAEIQERIEQHKMMERLQMAKQADQSAQGKNMSDMQLEAAKLRLKSQQDAQAHELAMAKLGFERSEADKDREQKDRQFYDQLYHDATLEREKLLQSAETARQQSEADERAMKALGEPEAADEPG